MLIPVIEFDLNGQRFTVEDTEDNLSLINHNPLTRRIAFSQAFDWQLPKIWENEPTFISFGTTVLDTLDSLADATDYELASDNEDVMA